MKFFLATLFLSCLISTELFAGVSPGKDTKFFDLCWHLDPQLFRWNINKQELLEKAPEDRPVYEWKIETRGGYLYNGDHSYGDYLLASDILVNVGNHISLQNRLLSKRLFALDSLYRGKSWRGFRGYNELATLRFHSTNMELKIGRDYLVTGPMYEDNLLFSNNPKSFNHYLASIWGRHLKFSFWGVQLDNIWAFENCGDASRSVPRQRYIAGHRLDIALFDDHLLAGLSESVLFYNEGNNFDLALANPLQLMHGYASNDYTGNANSFITADFSWRYSHSSQLMGELLIDDFQVDNATVADEEPAEYGVKLVHHNRWTRAVRSDYLYFGYERVSPRTFNTVDIDRAEKWMFQNVPIGAWRGNNYESLFLQIGSRANSGFWQQQCHYSITRHGSDTIYNDFSIDDDGGYQSAFPLGDVMLTHNFGARGWLDIGNQWGVILDIECSSNSENAFLVNQASINILWFGQIISGLQGQNQATE